MPASNLRPILCLVTDRSAVSGSLEAAVEAAVAAGVDWVQIRERALEGSDLLEHAESVRRAAERGAANRRGPVRVLINRRADVALALGTDGLHLGFDGMPVDAARRLLGEEALVGIATHSEADAARHCGKALARLPSYLHLTPIFPPLSKAGTGRALGPEALRDVAQHQVPVLAQGGIRADRVAAVLSAGAAGVAVTGAILGSDDPGRAAAELRRALDG